MICIVKYFCKVLFKTENFYLFFNPAHLKNTLYIIYIFTINFDNISENSYEFIFLNNSLLLVQILVEQDACRRLMMLRLYFELLYLIHQIILILHLPFLHILEIILDWLYFASFSCVL